MRNLLLLSIGLVASAVLSGAAYGHGSNVFGSGEAGHTHAVTRSDHATEAGGDAFEELHQRMDHLEDMIIAHDQRIRVADIIGGLGYIVGITGIAYYYLGVRRNRERPTADR